MKSIRQKAKAYDKALEIVRPYYEEAINSEKTASVKLFESMFDELRNNDDENIRKKLINLVKKSHEQGGYALHKWEADEMLNWLEKVDKDNKFLTSIKVGDVLTKSPDGILINLGKSDRALEYHDKVEPKFKVGDWVVNNISKDVFLIKSINNGYCTLEDIKGNIISPCLPPCESESHLWTIQDANDGDVLNTKGAPFIYKKHDKDYVYLYCGVNLSNEFVEAKKIDSWNNNNKVYPATKEQRDTLIKAMRNAGYEWDDDRKELKKIDWNEHIKYNPNTPSILKKKPATIDIDKMVDDYANNDERGNEEFGKPTNGMIRAYKQGLNDAIGKLS